MGFFTALGIDGPAAVGTRQSAEADGRFCELRKIGNIHDVDAVTEALMSVTIPRPKAARSSTATSLARP